MIKGLKITALALCAALLVSLFTVSFAAEAEATASSIMVDGGSLELTLLDDFSTAQGSLIQTPYSTGTVEFPVNDAGGKGLKINIAQGESISVPSYIAWDGTVSSGFVHKTVAQTKYIALNVTVSGTVKFALEPQLTGYGDEYGGLTVQGYICGNGDAIYLVDNNGATTVATVEYMTDANRYVINNIPQGFNGYIVIPTSRFTDSIEQTNAGSWNSGNMEGFVNLWTMQFFLNGTSSDSITVNDCYYSNSTINYNPTSWIKSIEKTGDGVARITYIDNFPADTYWSEIAIFTSPADIADVYDIYDNKCDRGQRNATVGYVKEGILSGTIGPDNTDYDFPYQFTPGTTYYVYVARCNTFGQWSYQTEPYVFNYPENPVAIPTATLVPYDTDTPVTESPSAESTTLPPESDVTQTPFIPTEKNTAETEYTQPLTQEPTTPPPASTSTIPATPIEPATQAPTAAITTAPTKVPTKAPQNTATTEQPEESVTPTDPLGTAPVETAPLNTAPTQTEQPTEEATPVSSEVSTQQSQEASPQATQAPEDNGGYSTVIIIIAVIAAAGAAVSGFLFGRKTKH